MAYEFQCAIVEKTHSGVITPWVIIRRSVFADDAQWPCKGREGVVKCLFGLERATHHTNFCSDALKTIVLGVARERFLVRALNGDLALWNMKPPVAGQGVYVRVQGRHALSHIYYRVFEN